MAENRADEQPVAGTGTTEPTDDATATVPKARAAQPPPASNPAPPDEDKPRKAAKKAARAAEPAATPTGEKAAKKAAKKTAGRAAKKSTNAAAKTTAKSPAKAASTAPRPAEQGTAVTPTEPAPTEPAPTEPAPTEPAPAVPAAAAPAPAAAAVPGPDQPAVTVPVPVAGTAVPAAPGAWAAAAWEAVRQLDQPPQRLAELAVAEIGPRAAAWADWLRRTYPGAPADGIARLAGRQAGRHGRAVALAGIGGPLAAPFCLPAAAWVRVSVVLRVAAAYGHDPADPARAAELIELLELGPADPEVAGAGGFSGRAVAILQRLDRVRFAVIPRRLRRRSPVAALQVLAVVADHGDSIERLAHRAVRRYRPGSHSSSQASAESSSSA